MGRGIVATNRYKRLVYNFRGTGCAFKKLIQALKNIKHKNLLILENSNTMRRIYSETTNVSGNEPRFKTIFKLTRVYLL